MDFFKEVKDFFSERLRSPIITSISFVFFLLNWPSLFNLVFGDTTVLERIEYFDANTTICSKYVFPVAFGFMLASIWPWIAFAGSKIVSRGVARTKEFQIEEAHKVQLQRIILRGEIQDEQDRIARERENTIEQIARQRKQAVEDVGEENLQRVKETFEQLESVEKEEWDDWAKAYVDQLHPVKREIILQIGSSERRISITSGTRDHYEILRKMAAIAPNHTKIRQETELQTCLDELVSERIADRTAGEYALTLKGFEVFDLLKF
ncbi:hypothetical protein [Marivivens donghaensis]|uniref:hypothetical protein n=1 Tax=Marivivens donghaensis TaxID=1699413 RepID=UPI00201F3C0C|nr:hypothetical protein [Marivivens donghaensis]MCL7409714.1 hypothetical protein [Marivivens donghaensis]MDN3705149.1 hypothetical protein [Marivivens donghaensis]